jgi:hypothetical protein
MTACPPPLAGVLVSCEVAADPRVLQIDAYYCAALVGCVAARRIKAPRLFRFECDGRIAVTPHCARVFTMHGKGTVYDVLFSVGIESVATADRACRKTSGNSRPRFSALRRIPEHAFGLKKYFCGTFSSKICDKEHTPPSLRHSEVLSVKNSPRDVTRPAFSKRIDDSDEISSIVRGKSSWYVFPNRNSRS